LRKFFDFCWKAGVSAQGCNPATLSADAVGAKLNQRVIAKIKANNRRIDLFPFITEELRVLFKSEKISYLHEAILL
jgi:hypothetical protein